MLPIARDLFLGFGVEFLGSLKSIPTRRGRYNPPCFGTLPWWKKVTIRHRGLSRLTLIILHGGIPAWTFYPGRISPGLIIIDLQGTAAMTEMKTYRREENIYTYQATT
jgi:hypothetical protein